MKSLTPIEPVVDDLPLRLAWSSGDIRAYALGAIRLGVEFTDDDMVTHRGQAAADHWLVWANLAPWER